MNLIKMFRKILDYMRPQYRTKENFTLPLELTESEWKRLQSLFSSEDFRIYQKTLDNLVSLYGESLLATTETDELHFLRGKIQGIRKAVEIVDEIHKKEQDFLINERRRTDRRVTPESIRKLATYGTPGWRT